ncbi:hypothetical protein Ocin01_02551 [Orchesella cincta]|uniref:BCL2/adenovirus E1B 19 kDa protein-interacting protein 3 n=1 Tax=Orchesella cincta TaxID=48709 RepID=A0A1D2NGB6_ORCCI|nr:hypothetical protein Ocin01_02551 [Orchesella cincta]
MSSTPKSIGEESLSESWVDVSLSPGRVTPVAVPTVGLLNGSGQLSSHIGEEYLRLLKEAQRESNYSSSRVSVASSRRDSRCATPKSPPNSPNSELATGDEELKDIYINKESDTVKEWINTYWYPYPTKPKPLRSKAKFSLRNSKCCGRGLFSRDVMFTFFLSNILSLLIGAGIGLWISKKSNVIVQFPVD